ncbi:MAG: maleylpyruvate isomerase N-terminal domain-containing protein, partial [Pseudonocardiaceae bacterium]
SYLARVDALQETWQVWAELGGELTDEQWSRPTRCPGWDVAAVYAHHSEIPQMLSAPLPIPVGAPDAVTAVEILRRFNAPDGVAHTSAQLVADHAISEAGRHSRSALVERFTVHGPHALHQLRRAEATTLVPWPASGLVVTLSEALRIVLMEAAVHLLDVQRALDHRPSVPMAALRDTTHLLAELAPAVEFIEAAIGRSTHSPLPLLR